MQNLLNWADRASTVPNRSSKEFSGKNGALPAQTMTIPVTTGVNRDATVLNLGLYRPITGANRGGCLQRARLITVETRTLRLSSRCNRPEFPPSQFFPRGKNGPAQSFPGEKIGWPILSPPSQFFPPP